MHQSLPAIIDLFRKKVNLLIIDDDEIIRDSLMEMFSSPLFNTVTTGSLDQALEAVGNTLSGWHCLVVDLDLGNKSSGLTLLKKYAGYPFAVVLSGLRSMTLAAEAMSLGACAIVDKDPTAVEGLYDQVLKTAALGFLLNGRSTPHLNTFRFLQDPAIASVDAWAEKSGITPRTLYRICEAYPPLTPHYALALYRSIHFLLTITETTAASPDFAIPPLSAPREHNGCSTWIEYILLNYKG